MSNDQGERSDRGGSHRGRDAESTGPFAVRTINHLPRERNLGIAKGLVAVGAVAVVFGGAVCTGGAAWMTYDHQEEVIVQKEEVIVEQKDVIAKQADGLKAKDGVITTQADTIGSQKQAIAVKDEKISDQSKMIAAQGKTITVQGAQIDEQKGTIAHERAINASLQAAQVARDETIAGLEAEKRRLVGARTVDAEKLTASAALLAQSYAKDVQAQAEVYCKGDRLCIDAVARGVPQLEARFKPMLSRAVTVEYSLTEKGAQANSPSLALFSPKSITVWYWGGKP